MILWLLAACTMDQGPRGAVEVPEDGALLVATTDFEVGTIALVDPRSGDVQDMLALTGGDPQVRAHGGFAIVIDRYGGDSIRLYDPTDWATPRHTIPISAGANVHDTALVSDRLHISQYERAEVLIAGFPGSLIVDQVDLTLFADDDGLPEASSLLVVGEQVFAAVQRFDRDAGWSSSDGRIVRLDDDAHLIAEVGPSPRLFAHDATDTAILQTGLFFTADGALSLIDTVTGTTDPVVHEQDLDADLGAYAEVEGVGVLTGTSLDGTSARVWCLDWSSGVLVDGPVWEGGWIPSVTAGPDGRVWLAVRSGWGGPDVDTGLFRLDATSCVVDEHLETSLEPYDVVAL